MGTHTNFYKKLNLTQEEAKQNCLVKLNRDREYLLSEKGYWSIINKELNCFVEEYIEELNSSKLSEKDKQNILSSTKLLSIKDKDFLLEVIDRKIKMVENNLCQRAVWNNLWFPIDEYHDKVYEYIDGKGLYIDLDEEFMYQFKCNFWNDRIFFSYEEVMKELKDGLEVDYEFIVKIKEFWKKYPDGIIVCI